MVAKVKKKPCAKLVKAAKHWRSALRLDDWLIDVCEPTAEQRAEMQKDNQKAYVMFSAPHRTATVVLGSLTRFNTEIEEDLVHELLHLVFVQYSVWAGQGRPLLDDLQLEQALNTVAVCLVKLKNESGRTA